MTEEMTPQPEVEKQPLVLPQPTQLQTNIAPSKRLVQWWVDLLARLSAANGNEMTSDAKDEAKNRLKLVLMHDRTQLSPTLLESMRDELVQVISKYVEIDQSTLDLCLEQESNNIALVANIAVVRSREGHSTL